MTLDKQIFVRLYLVIVVSVISVGIVIDYFWQSSNDNISEISHHEELVQLISWHLDSLADISPNAIQKTQELASYPIGIISLQEIQANNLRQALSAGEIITLENEIGDIAFYKQLSNHPLVLIMTVPDSQHSEWQKYLMLVCFYLLIALAVYFWTLPLTKDLKTLEKAASSFAQSQWDTQVDIPPSSPITHLADAYNQLLIRIKELIKDQQEMSHAISHELRTPLARMKFSLELALNNADSQQVGSQLSSIKSDIEEIQQLVDELLSYATLEKSTTTASFEKGDIASLVQSLIAKLARNTQDKKLTFNAVKSSTQIYCDSYLIERGLQNLIVNALNHCKSEVHVSFQQTRGFNLLIVDDDGTGIPENERQRVFDSFVRLSNQAAKPKGFGLGLAIVKRIATLHRGKVLVDSAPMGGARFIIEWPNQRQYKS